MVKIAYFVHDLADPAVAKRVRMLRAGGAEVALFGFRRSEALPAIEGLETLVDLGRTHDAQFGQRMAKLAAQAPRAAGWGAILRRADVVMARNLEMLLLASLARALHRPSAGLVYECLDVHRLMLSDGLPGRLLRGLERGLMRRADRLIVSSPAFLTAYFEPRQGLGGKLRVPVELVENKLFEPRPPGPTEPPPRPAGPPWRIGWYGAIRCRRSLDMLTELASRRPDLVQVSIRGKPSYTEFADFDGQVAETPGVSFGGPYTAADLERLYADVHFSWAVDYFEAGANSNWLLPNRIYEGGRYGAVPLALREVETGRWLARRGLGVLMQDPASELEPFLESLDPARFGALEAASRAAPVEAFVADLEDCVGLVAALAETRPRRETLSAFSPRPG